MSRATSAVDIDADNGSPVVEHALPSPREEVTAACSCALVKGKATLSPASTLPCWALPGKHATWSLKLVPRGSNPTTSKRDSTSALRKNGAAWASAVPDP